MTGRVQPDGNPRDCVGPVLAAGPEAQAVIAAIVALNPGVQLLDRGAYVRVSVARRCVVTRAAIEAQLGRPFRLPRDLEAVMPAFKGRFQVDADQASWELAAS